MSDLPRRSRTFPVVIVLLITGTIVYTLSFWAAYGRNSEFGSDLCELLGTILLLLGATIAVYTLSRGNYITYLFITASFFLILSRVVDFTDEVPWFDGNVFLSRGTMVHVYLLRCSESLGYITILLTMLALMFELARSRTKAQQEENRFRELFQESQFLSRSVDLSSDAVVAVDGEGQVQVWNKGAERLFGYTRDEVLHRPLTKMIVDGVTGAGPDLVGRVKRQGATRETEVVAQRKGGERFAAGASFSPTLDDRGATVGATIILRDIEDRKNAERQLLASRNLLAGALQAADVAMLILDREGKIVEINSRFREIVGLSDAEVKSETLDTVVGRVLDDPENFLSMIRDAALGKGEHAEFRNVAIHRRDGVDRVCNGAVAPVRGEDGEVMGVACVAVDITERELLQAKLVEAQKMESVGRLAGGVAHDFNNLLAGVLGYATLLQDQLGPDSPHRKRLKTIEESALRASDLTRQLLTFARGGTRTVQTLSLNELVNETVELLAHSLDPNIQLSTHLASALDSINADRTQVGQVLMNLCLNSRDAIEAPGRIRITTKNVFVNERLQQKIQLASPGPYVLLSVEDSGHGMTLDTRQKMFDPFFSTKRPGEGYGLGLSVVYGIVKSHSGGLLVESEPKAGTRIDIYFPSAGAPIASSTRPVEWKRGLPRGTETVLVVDDEKLIRALLRDVFETVGYTVLEASTGEEGLAIYQSRPGDIGLVVLDMIMPGAGGADTLRKLLAIDPNLRCVVSSGHSNERFADDLLDGRFVRFVAKPFQTSTLLSTVRTLFDA